MLNADWITYVPLLPRELDSPEILALRAPKPTMMMKDIEQLIYFGRDEEVRPDFGRHFQQSWSF